MVDQINTLMAKSFYPSRVAGPGREARIGWPVIVGWLAMVFGIMFSPLSLADVTAQVDRDQVRNHETLTLTVVVSGDEQGDPDFSPLVQSFDIVSQFQSNSFNFINGRMESRRSWFVTLAPKEEGVLHIPAIAVGQSQTQPIRVEVLPALSGSNQGQAPDIFLEVDLEPKTAYVQSQIAYTLRIFSATELTSGQLSGLTPDNAIVERLGDDRAYQRMQGGRRYHVRELRYAIFPQSSGTLALPPIVFNGSVAVPAQQQGRNGFPPLFGGGLLGASKKVRVQSDVHTIDVKPRPSTSQAQWWLPARDVRLTEAWSDDPPVFRVGEPVTRTITLQATGVTAAQLPPLPAPELPDIKAYPDQPVTQNGSDGVWLIGARQDKIALVPAQAGEFTLPAIEIHWWDTAQDRERIARLPERVINVLPAEGMAMPPVVAEVAPAVAPPARATDPLPPAAAMPAGAGYWPWLAAFFGCAWLATLAVLIWQRRSGHAADGRGQDNPGQIAHSRAAAYRAVKRACDNNDARAARDALLSWAAANNRLAAMHSLGELANRMADENASRVVRELDKKLYARDAGDWMGSACWEAVHPVLRQSKKPQTKRLGQSRLPALYPSRSPV